MKNRQTAPVTRPESLGVGGKPRGIDVSAYGATKRELANGWNTWDTRSVLRHVFLPDGLAINLGLKEYASGGYLGEALVGRRGDGAETVSVGAHAYDGSYTELRVEWRGIAMQVQTAADGDQLAILVTPERVHRKLPLLVVEAGVLWNREGTLSHRGDTIQATFTGRSFRIHTSSETVSEPFVDVHTPYLAIPLFGPIAIAVGKKLSVDQIRQLVLSKQSEAREANRRYGELADAHAAMQGCVAWNTVYDPSGDRVITPVSRLWNCGRGGYVLFCWDTYFAGYMAGVDTKALAYANVIEMTREITENGFVPNVAQASGRAAFETRSRDRSQPPVGSLVARELYRQHRDAWFLEDVFEDLLAWNRWWPANRDTDGYLCWGSNPFLPENGDAGDMTQPNSALGAALESGLDNSPMYDGVPFDDQRHQMRLADVGLMSLYITDCEALADIADILNKSAKATALRLRAQDYRRRLADLWDRDTGMFLNRRLDTGEFSRRVSPTSFYPLLARGATDAQATRMVNEHLLNPREFWGDWVLPSTPRNDPAFPEQNYWRGRVWAPMNFLVYLGLRNYDLGLARRELVAKSQALLLKEWREHGHVHENYSAITGEGCDQPNSDPFYHWGGLLALMALMSGGHVQGPENPLLDSYRTRRPFQRA